MPSPESKAFVDTEIQVMKESILQTLKEKDVSAHSDNGSVISTRSKVYSTLAWAGPRDLGGQLAEEVVYVVIRVIFFSRCKCA